MPQAPERLVCRYCHPSNLPSASYHVRMKARILIVLAFALLVPALIAQTARHKAAATSTAAPTKVTGDGVTTPSGLQYWEIKVGTGDEAKEGDHVKVHYTGWFTDGKKFDSSVDAHQPYDFTLGKGDVIKGWDEGVTGMKVGGKRQFRIPPELAYGEIRIQRDHTAQRHADFRRAVVGRDPGATSTQSGPESRLESIT